MAEIINVDQNDKEILTGEVYKDDTRTAELWQQAGFFHIPEKKAEGLLTYIGRGRGNPVVILPKIRNILDLKAGETQIYSTKNGEIQSYIYLDSDGNIKIKSKKNIIIEDENNNKITKDNNGIKIEDKNNNKIEMKSGEIDIIGTMLKLLGATESFIKGDTLCNAFISLCSTIATATSGSMAQNAAGIETIKTAFSTFNGQINNFKSTTIKGE